MLDVLVNQANAILGGNGEILTPPSGVSLITLHGFLARFLLEGTVVTSEQSQEYRMVNVTEMINKSLL